MSAEPMMNGDASPKAEIAARLKKELNNFDFTPSLAREVQTLSDIGDETNKRTFRIMQWNILAQGLSLSGKFVLCPTPVLEFDRRVRYIILELLRYDADIICLEEVDMFERLDEVLSQVGYRGTFVKKDPSPCLIFPDNIGPDGCAIFYKHERLSCVASHSFQLGPQVSQVALVQQFRAIEDPDVSFFVTVTHLKAKPPFFEVRKSQGDFLLAKLNDICRQDLSQSPPVFVCCDMNAASHEAVVAAFKSSDLHFSSSYAQLDTEEKEPEFTTWKFRGEKDGDHTENCHTIDYLWYQKSSKVTLRAIVSIPSKQVIGERGLPCPAFPSDHVSLVADFSIRSDL